MTTLTIDLQKNPELAALVSDKQPGDWIELRASIKAKDEQTLTVRLENCDDCEKPKAEGDDSGEETEAPAPAAAPEEKPSKALARKLTAPSNDLGY